jgi:nucleotide-binding universal stress UspA family protein
MNGSSETPVVVGIDGTGRSLRALMWAAHDAFLRGLPVHIVHTLPRYEGDFFLFPPGRFEAAEEHGRAMVAEALALVRQAFPDVPCATDMPMRSPSAALLDQAKHAHSLVLGGKGDNVGNLLLGSTALQVVGHARCPVVIVGHVSAGHDRIAVGTDGSASSAAALAYAFDEAHLRGAELHVVSGLGLPQGWPTHLLRPLPEDNAEVAARRQEVEEQAAPLRQRYPDVKVIYSVHRLEPLAALETASHHADLLVLGSRGRGGFHGLAVGSTTHKMLHFASCPMAVVHTEPAAGDSP